MHVSKSLIQSYSLSDLVAIWNNVHLVVACLIFLHKEMILLREGQVFGVMHMLDRSSFFAQVKSRSWALVCLSA